MITRKQVKEGISRGVIKFVIDPNMNHGTVCAIGNSWFYFGGLTAEEEGPHEYLAHVPIDDIAQDIFNVLDEFRTLDEFIDEYNYYESILDEANIPK